MKYLFANDQTTLANIDASDEIVLFPQNAVLAIESKTDTTSSIFAQSSADVDADIELVITHADKSAAATHKTERNLIDEIIAVINNDNRSGVGVLFDVLNDIKLPSQSTHAGSGAPLGTVTED